MPPAGQHRVRYFGWMHPSAKLRRMKVETLLQKLPRVGDSYQAKVSLYGGCDNSKSATSCTSGDSTEYEMSYEVRRVRDVAVPVNQ